jgi:hypothetical protein
MNKFATVSPVFGIQFDAELVGARDRKPGRNNEPRTMRTIRNESLVGPRLR